MQLARRLLLATILLTAFSVSAGAQVCTQLLPIGLLPPDGGFTTGCARQFNLKLGATLGPDGNYILLSYPACAGGPCAGLTGVPLLQCASTDSYWCCLSVLQMIPTLTGTNVGTLATGFNLRVANDNDSRAGICFAVYQGNNVRLGNVPLIQWIGADRTQAQVIGFQRVFLVGPTVGTGQNTTIPVEFIGDPTPVPTLAPTWGRLKVLYH